VGLILDLGPEARFAQQKAGLGHVPGVEGEDEGRAFGV
jgi:hypothetical protein